MTDVNTTAEVSSSHPPDIFRASICTILTTMGICADSFCMFVLYRAKEINKITRLLMASLALSDLCVGFFGLIPLVWSASIGGWPEAISPTCVLHMFALQLFQYCGISAIMFLNLECYIAITRPLKYVEIVTRKRTLVLITMQWTFWMTWGITMFLIFKDNVIYDHHFGFCIIKYSYRKLSFVISRAVLHIFIPVFVVIVMYCRILCIARRHMAQIAEQKAMQRHLKVSPVRMRDYKVYKSVLFVTISIAIFWIPFTVIEIYETVTGDPLPHLVVSIGELLEFSIPWMNVLILFLKYGTFRNVAIKLFAAAVDKIYNSRNIERNENS
ncbi:adenosine receptor A3-like [Amphiura filiformis]|uniref:adenosine receptor A3-like n=1 Tax=Amphiura filiformis TaxID=82378 RepID=UPI003B20BE6D